MNEFLERIHKKNDVITALRKYRPALIAFFQEVVRVNTEVQPQTKTPIVNFTHEVIRDLPPRMRSAFMAEFENWLDRNGRDFLDSDIREGVDMDLEVTRIQDAVQIVVYDSATAFSVVETVSYRDLAPFLQAGLDYHPQCGTFFIPRS